MIDEKKRKVIIKKNIEVEIAFEINRIVSKKNRLLEFEKII